MPDNIISGGKSPLDRRGFLRVFGGGAAAVAGGAVLAACGVPTSSGSGSDSGGGKVALQFVFIKNVQFAGSYFADSKGYWKQRGLDVELLAGGPNLTVEPVVESGRALVGITHTAQAVKAILSGADLKIIGAGFQTNPFVLISRAVRPIKTPKDLAGKKIGVQALDLPVFTAFLKAVNVDRSTFTIVPLQSDPTPLATGELDGIMGFYSNEPNFLRIKGVEPYTMLLNEFGYPLMEEAYVVRQASLDDPAKRKQIVALMQGESLDRRAGRRAGGRRPRCQHLRQGPQARQEPAGDGHEVRAGRRADAGHPRPRPVLDERRVDLRHDQLAQAGRCRRPDGHVHPRHPH
jgi:ABC-type nitrate/sulfonate/bicarbonate transport system substrate-binding protein